MSSNEEHIVVGVDGSAGSRTAFRWALRYAEKTQAHITALSAWSHTTLYGLGALTLEERGIDEAAATTLAQVVDEGLGELRSQTAVQQKVQRGVPAQVLVDASATADLLVVGSRGHGGVTGALLGSVSQHCVHHASCPVVIVRHTPTKSTTTQ